MKYEGWIKIHRKINEWRWKTDSNTIALFMDLLINANHQDKEWLGITIRKGQLATSFASLSKRTGLSVQSVRTSINRLKSTNEITSHSTNRFTLITVTNWDKYQLSPTNQLTNEQQANNKEITTNNKVKNEKNEKKRDDQKFELFWKQYPNKVGKLRAKTIWSNLTEVDKDKALQVLPAHIKREQWNRDEGRFIPHPATWLNQGRWDDEIATEKPQVYF